MIPDHDPNDGAAPEQYDADWFLSQLRGRRVDAAVPASPSGVPGTPPVESSAKRPDAAAVPESEVERGGEPESPAVEAEPELESVELDPVDAVPEPEPEDVELEPADAVPEPEPEDSELEPADAVPEPEQEPEAEDAELEPVAAMPASTSSRLGARRPAGMMGGIAAAAAIIAVAGAAFAASGIPRVQSGDIEGEGRPGAFAPLDPTRSPQPTGTQLPTLPEPPAPERGAPEVDPDDGAKDFDPVAGPPDSGPGEPPTGAPSAEPTHEPNPTPTEEPTPTPTPTDEPTPEPTPDPEPSTEPTPEPEPSTEPTEAPLCELLPILC